MPVATVSTEAVQYELKSCPGGTVTLKRMSYGAWLHRRDITMKMTFTGGADDAGAELDNKAVTAFEFSQCITDHNLTDEQEVQLNFKQPSTVDRLNTQIGEEISQLIASMHEFEAELPN